MFEKSSFKAFGFNTEWQRIKITILVVLMGCLLISFGGTHHLRFSPESCQTSRDRPKSAPYPRLKNSKRTSKCQFTVLQNRKTKKWTEWRAGAASASPWRAKRGTLPESSTYLSQLKGGPFGEKTNFRKLSMPKN